MNISKMVDSDVDKYQFILSKLEDRPVPIKRAAYQLALSNNGYISRNAIPQKEHANYEALVRSGTVKSTVDTQGAVVYKLNKKGFEEWQSA